MVQILETAGFRIKPARLYKVTRKRQSSPPPFPPPMAEAGGRACPKLPAIWLTSYCVHSTSSKCTAACNVQFRSTVRDDHMRGASHCRRCQVHRQHPRPISWNATVSGKHEAPASLLAHATSTIKFRLGGVSDPGHRKPKPIQSLNRLQSGPLAQATPLCFFPSWPCPLLGVAGYGVGPRALCLDRPL